LSVMYVSSASLSSSFFSVPSRFLAFPFYRCVVFDERRLTGSHIKMRFSVVIKSFHRITTSTSPRAEKVEAGVVRVAQVTEKELQ
jgi:hypothetical protein